MISFYILFPCSLTRYQQIFGIPKFFFPFTKWSLCLYDLKVVRYPSPIAIPGDALAGTGLDCERVCLSCVGMTCESQKPVLRNPPQGRFWYSPFLFGNSSSSDLLKSLPSNDRALKQGHVGQSRWCQMLWASRGQDTFVLWIWILVMPLLP